MARSRSLVLAVLALAVVAGLASAAVLTVVSEPPSSATVFAGDTVDLPFEVNVSYTDILLDVFVNLSYDPVLANVYDAYIVLPNGTSLPLNVTAASGVANITGTYNLSGNPPGIARIVVVMKALKPGTLDVPWYYNFSALVVLPGGPGGPPSIALLENMTGNGTTTLTIRQRLVGGLFSLEQGGVELLAAASAVAAAVAAAATVARRKS